MTVAYSVAGNAQSRSDYQELPGSVTIPAGTSSTTVDVLPSPTFSLKFLAKRVRKSLPEIRLSIARNAYG
jgi:hypothetical protein